MGGVRGELDDLCLLIRHYVYDDKDGSFSPLPTLKSSNKCVVCVWHFFHQVLVSSQSPIDEGSSEVMKNGTPAPQPILCSTSTDGCISLWNLSPILMEWRLRGTPDTEPGAVDAPPLARFKVHQSGINDVAVQSRCVGGVSRHVLVSAGDDNALGVVYFTVSMGCPGNMLVHVDRQHVLSTAHASALTGTSML